MNGHHLLVVDDQEDIQEILMRLFTHLGYRVTTASGGAQALKALEEVRPDLILADYFMPDMTGIAFFKRAQEVCPDAVRILMTGYADLEVALAAINEAKVYKFITKPWNDEDLILTVQRALEHYDLLLNSRAFAATLEMMVDEDIQEIERLRTALREIANRVRHLS